jgi:hypothetical protein
MNQILNCDVRTSGGDLDHRRFCIRFDFLPTGPLANDDRQIFEA